MENKFLDQSGHFDKGQLFCKLCGRKARFLEVESFPSKMNEEEGNEVDNEMPKIFSQRVKLKKS